MLCTGDNLSLFSCVSLFQPFHIMVGNLKQSPMMEEMEKERDEVVFLEHFYEGISTNLRTLNDRKENNFIVKNLLLGNQGKEIKQLMQQKEILAEDAVYYIRDFEYPA